MTPLPEVVVAEIEALRAAKSRLPRCSQTKPGEDYHAAIDAQLRTLGEGFTFEQVARAGWPPYVEQSALEARDWLNGEPVSAPSIIWRKLEPV